MPLLESEVDISVEFRPEEPLYRRILASELTNGEIGPNSLNSVSFDKNVSGAPSVLRGAFARPIDALHSDCAGGKNVSNHLVFFILVRDLPSPIQTPEGNAFEFYPLHKPLPTCGAHSVIASCSAGDPARAYAKPSRPARNDLRAKLAVLLQPVVDLI